jgi:hypothetical protein
MRAELRRIRTLLCGATSDYKLLRSRLGGQDQPLAGRLTAILLGLPSAAYLRCYR